MSSTTEIRIDNLFPTEQRDRLWLLAAAAITALATFLRFYHLGLKPLHHDEGVNGFFLTTLLRDAVYKYDPANYHGPTLYYLALPFVEFFGLNTIPVRVSVAIFGVLMVVLALYFRRYLGDIGTLIAALFVALSPGMVFISRYFIHEIFFVFLSLAIVLAVILFIERRSAGPMSIVSLAVILLVCFLPTVLNLGGWLGGTNQTAVWICRIGLLIGGGVIVYYLTKVLLEWDNGRPIYLLLCSACISLYFATKETAFITLGTMLIACACIWAWNRIRALPGVEAQAPTILAALNGVAILLAVVYWSGISEGFTALTNAFTATAVRPAENFVLYSIFLLTVGTLIVWVLFLLDLRKPQNGGFEEPVQISWAKFREGFGDESNRNLILAASAALFVYIGILFFSSFFTYAEGVKKAFEAYAIWTKTGSKDHTQNGWFGYVKWAMKVESPIFLIGILGSMIAIIKARHRVPTFVGLWGVGLFMAYTIIPYKTPWLALSFLLPMCLSGGYAIGELFESKNFLLKCGAAVLAIAGVSLLSYQTYQHNFVRYDDDDMSYVYAHTKRGFLDLMSEVERYAEKSGKGTDATIEIVSPDYWPMTWYLNKYSHANFHGALVNATTAEMVITKKNDQDTAAIQRYSPHYRYVGVYPLRPGVNLVLLVRKDLADPNSEELYKILDYKPVAGYTQ